MGKQYWIALVTVFLAMVATSGYFLYQESKPEQIVGVPYTQDDGSVIIVPDPNFNPNYMDNPLGTLIIPLIEGTYKIYFPMGDSDITL